MNGFNNATSKILSKNEEAEAARRRERDKVEQEEEDIRIAEERTKEEEPQGVIGSIQEYTPAWWVSP